MSTPASTASALLPPPTLRLGIGFAIIYLVWGSTYLAIRVAVETLPPFAMSGVRFTVAGGILYTWLRARGNPRPSWSQVRSGLVIGALMLLGGNGLVAWAEQWVPSGVTAMIIAIGPLFMVLTEWAWPGGTAPRRSTLVALAVGFAGVVWLVAPWQNGAADALHLPGVAAIMLGSVCWSLGSIASRHQRQGPGTLMGAALQMLGGALALSLVGALRGEFAHLDLTAISLRSLLAWLYLVFVGSLLAFSTFVWLLKHSTPARVSTHAWVNPVVAIFLGWLFLHEPITTRTLTGSAIIVLAVILITRRAKPRAA